MNDNILLDPLGYVARGIIRAPRSALRATGSGSALSAPRSALPAPRSALRAPRYRLQPISAEERAEVEARHAKQRALDAMRRDESVDEDGDPTF